MWCDYRAVKAEHAGTSLVGKGRTANLCNAGFPSPVTESDHVSGLRKSARESRILSTIRDSGAALPQLTSGEPSPLPPPPSGLHGWQPYQKRQ
jgi:hypothetical protein